MKYILLILLLSSCSAVYHYDKAIKKGIKIDDSKDTIQIPKIIYRDSIIPGTDSIIRIPQILYRDTIIYKSVTSFPKTKKEVKTDFKLEKEKLKVEEKIKTDSIKQTAKTERVKVRTTNKPKNKWWKFYIGIVVGILITLIFTGKIKIT